MSLHGGLRRLSDVLEARESLDLGLPIQIPSRPSTPPPPAAPLIPVIDLNTGAMDEEVERHLIKQANQIGAEIPPEPGSRKISEDIEVISANVSAITVSTQDTNTIPSRTSESTRPTSCDSSIKNDYLQPVRPQPQPQQQRVRPSHSFRRAPSSSGVSIAESTSSNSSKFLKGFRRLSSLSSFSKKRASVISNNNPHPVRPSMESTVSDSYISRRPTTADLPDPADVTGPTTFSTRSRSLKRTPSNVSRASSIGAVSLPATSTSYAAMSGRSERAALAAERAKRRTLQSPRLQSVRLRQIDEQTQFLEYHTSLWAGIRARSQKELMNLQSAYEESKDQLEDSHAQVHASLEERHLAAEIELSRTLQQERQACDTKLKHMDAYCNGRLSVIDGKTPPRRKVTDEDYRKLVQQYQVRQGMDNLHESRINVLRKKQAKQVERILQRQQAESDALRKEFETERRRKVAAARREEDELRADFESKKERLQWRWKLMETVECKKLEMETGMSYGEMPDMQWGDHELIGRAA